MLRKRNGFKRAASDSNRGFMAGSKPAVNWLVCYAWGPADCGLPNAWANDRGTPLLRPRGFVGTVPEVIRATV